MIPRNDKIYTVRHKFPFSRPMYHIVDCVTEMVLNMSRLFRNPSYQSLLQRLIPSILIYSSSNGWIPLLVRFYFLAVLVIYQTSTDSQTLKTKSIKK